MLRSVTSCFSYFGYAIGYSATSAHALTALLNSSHNSGARNSSTDGSSSSSSSSSSSTNSGSNRSNNDDSGSAAKPPPEWYKRGTWIDPAHIEKRMTDETSTLQCKKEPETTITKQVKAFIKYRGGPMSVAEYMKEVLVNPLGGFYGARGGTAIGAGGHFITSPEISTLFAEVLAAWALDAYGNLGRPQKVRFVELGPGRGTLTQQMLTAIRMMPGGPEALAGMHVHLVEVSPDLRQQQHDALRCEGTRCVSEVDESSADGQHGGSPEEGGTTVVKGRRSAVRPGTTLRHDAAAQTARGGDLGLGRVALEAGGPQEGRIAAVVDPIASATSASTGCSVSWHYHLDEVPSDAPIIVIGHEYLDALPVHIFRKDEERGWLEVLVDESQSPTDEKHFQFVLSPQQTRAVQHILYRRLRAVRGADAVTQIEVNAEAMAIAETVARRIDATGGVALFIDYGKDAPYDFSLNAIKHHAPVHPLQEPGTADLTAWVDFDALRQAVRESGAKAAASGPIPQGYFLMALGMEARLDALLQKQRSDGERRALEDGFARLCAGTDHHPQGMGHTYKAMVVAPSSSPTPYPFNLDFESLIKKR